MAILLGKVDTAHIIIKILGPHGWSIQFIARRILKLDELLKMVEPFLSILHKIRQSLTQNSHKFAIGIMKT